MNILEINEYLIIHVLSFLHGGEYFILNETCKTLYNLLKFKELTPKVPSVYNIIRSINMIKWAKTHKKFKYTSKFTQLAIRRNKSSVVKYLYNDCCEFNRLAYSEAIRNNNFKIVRWLKRRRISLSTKAFSTAAESGNLKILEWLKKKKCPWDHKCLNSAIKSMNISVIKFVIDNGCDWDIDTFNYACEIGNLECVKYLYSIAFNDLSKPWWNSNTASIAAKNGHLHILKFLREKGCSWNSNTTYNAFKNNHIEVLNWAITNNCPADELIINSISNNVVL